jgi:NADH-quinone oxidoreductase subunit K
MVPIAAYLFVSAVLFVAGTLTVLLRRGAISMLMGIEVMLNAGNLAFVAFSRMHSAAGTGAVDGQIAVFFTIAIAAAEAAVGLGVVIALFRVHETTDVDDLNLLKW